MRSFIKTIGILITANMYFTFACVMPAFATTVPSTTGYIRVVPQASNIAYLAGNATRLVSTAAPAIGAAAAGASVGVRLVASPVGLAALGITAGLGLLAWYLSPNDVQDIKSGTASMFSIPNDIVINGQQQPQQTYLTQNTCSPTWYVGCTQEMLIFAFPDFTGCSGSSSTPLGITGWSNNSRMYTQPSGGPVGCYNVYTYYGTTGVQANAATVQPGTATSQQIIDYMIAQGPSYQHSPQASAVPVGVTGSDPTTAATNVITLPQDLSAFQTVVIANTAASPGDTVVNANAPAPQNTEETQTASSTTTTTTNPDGSETQDTTASVSCDTSAHDQRTFGQVLTDRQTGWQSSALLGTLELLKNLTWPTAIPVFSVNSSVFGMQSWSLSDYQSIFDAVRLILIAGAGFSAYRIVFAGS
ncbi:MAG: hypothetical protein OEY86_14805 [Nitrospira sp.]|nr:hypothetical protein [Nitrospira sp.]